MLVGLVTFILRRSGISASSGAHGWPYTFAWLERATSSEAPLGHGVHVVATILDNFFLHYSDHHRGCFAAAWYEHLVRPGGQRASTA